MISSVQLMKLLAKLVSYLVHLHELKAKRWTPRDLCWTHQWQSVDQQASCFHRGDNICNLMDFHYLIFFFNKISYFSRSRSLLECLIARSFVKISKPGISFFKYWEMMMMMIQMLMIGDDCAKWCWLESWWNMMIISRELKIITNLMSSCFENWQHSVEQFELARCHHKQVGHGLAPILARSRVSRFPKQKWMIANLNCGLQWAVDVIV